MTGIVSSAAEAYKNGDYKVALARYKYAARKFGEKAFSLNIDLCNKKLGCIEDSVHPNDYFDAIYLVNMKHEHANRLKAFSQLRRLGIKAELFEGINGYEGEPLKAYQEYQKRGIGELKRYTEWNWREEKRGSKFLESPGAVGYIYTYAKIIRTAQAKGHHRILILEDDVLLAHDFLNKFTDFIQTAGADWKVLQLGASQYGWESVDKESALRDGYYRPRQLDTCGSFAIALDSSIFDQLLEAITALDAPFDHLPLGEIYEDYIGNCFVAYPNIAMADVSQSFIRNGREQYSHAKKVGWTVDNFPFPARRPTVSLVIQSFKSLKYINEFAKPEELPVELRIFYPSSDGLRPIHINGAFDLTQYDDDLSKYDISESSIDRSDYLLTIDKDSVLTESMLVAYIENGLGLSHNQPTELQEINLKKIDAVKGRATVVLPTYKRPGNLRTAAESVLEQEYEDLELIIVNDSGLDSEYIGETRALINELQEKYTHRNLKYFEHSINRNGAAARNTGILNSTGEYIMFLDDDDKYLPGRVSKSCKAMCQLKGHEGGVYCGFLGWNSAQNDLNRYPRGDLTKEILLLDYKKHYLHTNTGTYKREAIQALNGFDESYRRHQDLEFNLRFFRHFKISSVLETLVQLNPEPSDVSNKVFNMEMLSLKEKFLNQFDYIFEKSDEHAFIYKRHWDEVLRYINDVSEFKKSARKTFKNSFAQVLLELPS